MTQSTPKELFNAAVDQRVKEILAKAPPKLKSPPGLTVDASVAYVTSISGMWSNDTALKLVEDASSKNGCPPLRAGA